MKTVDVLIKARELVMTGWTQNRYCSTGKTCFCALGAIGMVCPGTYPGVDAAEDKDGKSNYPEGTLAAKYLAAALPVGNFGVASWNDAPGRTVGEVVQVFNRAIANARRRHLH